MITRRKFGAFCSAITLTTLSGINPVAASTYTMQERKIFIEDIVKRFKLKNENTFYFIIDSLTDHVCVSVKNKNNDRHIYPIASGNNVLEPISKIDFNSPTFYDRQADNIYIIADLKIGAMNIISTVGNMNICIKKQDGSYEHVGILNYE